jgi:hypothetical protein
MTIKEFRERLKGSKIKPDTEIVLHVEDGDFPVSTLEYDKREKKLRVCTDDWEKKSQYRVRYVVVKDHCDILAADEYRAFAASDEELLIDFDYLKDKILAVHGIKGEKNEKSGSTEMEIPDWDYVAKDGVVVRKETKKKHYFSCRLVEILKIVDNENDVYLRVWHDGESC